MISMKEILCGRITLEALPKEIQENLKETLRRINIVRAKYDKPMKVNDGIRLAANYGAAKSKHLLGLAIDIDDDDKGTLWFWLMQPEQMQMLKEVGLWLEHGNWTHSHKGTWVHFQIQSPGSGKRIFIPNTTPDPNPTFWKGYDRKYD